VHVLLTGVVVAVIAATLLRLSLLRSQMGSRGVKMLAEKRATQGGLASIMSIWNSVNTSCANVPASSGMICYNTIAPSPPGNCGCYCLQATTPGPDVSTLPHAIYTCPNDGSLCTGPVPVVPAPAAGCTVAIVSTDIQ
jgi:hypothetical protein